MIFSKRLLLKVIGGGVGLIGAGGAVAYKVSNSNSKKNGVDVDSKGAESVKNVKENVDSTVTKRIREEKNKVEVDELGISVECKANEVKDKKPQTCQLFDDQIKKIKFELTSGKEVSLYGLSWKNELTLTIEYTDYTEHFPDNKKYIFLNRAPGDNEIKMQNLKGGDVVLKINGPGFTFRKNGDKLEKAPFEDKFGIPLTCQSYKVTKKQSKTCQLTETQLKKVKFEPRDGGSITVTGLGNNKVNLTISDASEDKTNYPKGKKYTFKSEQATVTIKGTKDEDIILEKGKEITFGEKNGNVLERVVEIDNLGIPRVCEKSECDLGKKDLEKIKFENFFDNGTIVGGLDGNKKIKLKVEKESGKNKYYIFKGTDTKTILTNASKNIEFKVGYYSYFKEEGGKLKKEKEENEFSLLGIPSSCGFEENNSSKKECDLNVSDLKNFKFSIKGSGDLIITPSTSSNKIKLKIESAEGDKEYTDGIRYILKNIKDSITISGTGGEKIDFNPTNDDEMWFKKNKDGKLEKVRTVPKVDNLGIPVSCGFKNSDDPKECNLEVHHLEKINFSFREGKPLKATVTEGIPTIKLVRSKVDENKNEDPLVQAYPVESIKYTFEVKEGNIRVSNGEKEMHFKKETNLVFSKKDKKTNELERSWDADKLGNSIDLSCFEDGKSCLPKNQTIRVIYDGQFYEAIVKESNKSNSPKSKLKYFDYQEGYNQGLKFVPEENIPLKDQNKNLTTKESFEIKYHEGKNNWYLTKVNTQVTR